MAKCFHRARDIIQGFATPKSNFEAVSLRHFLYHQLGLDEGDRAKITCDVDKIIRHLAQDPEGLAILGALDIARSQETNYISSLMYLLRVFLL